MSRAYHEDKTHGTSVFPLQVYSHHDKDGFYFVSQHWHEELEWVYAEYGILNLTIHGKSLVLNPGEFCFINSGELHEIKSIGESLHHAVVFNPSFLDFSLPASIILSGRLPTEHCCFQPSAPRFHPKTINKSCSICRRL